MKDNVNNFTEKEAAAQTTTFQPCTCIRGTHIKRTSKMIMIIMIIVLIILMKMMTITMLKKPYT